jgi:hypothetical protein
MAMIPTVHPIGVFLGHPNSLGYTKPYTIAINLHLQPTTCIRIYVPYACVCVCVCVCEQVYRHTCKATVAQSV